MRRLIGLSLAAASPLAVKGENSKEAVVFDWAVIVAIGVLVVTSLYFFVRFWLEPRGHGPRRFQVELVDHVWNEILLHQSGGADGASLDQLGGRRITEAEILSYGDNPPRHLVRQYLAQSDSEPEDEPVT